MNIVPCLTWVKQGSVNKSPQRVLIDREDLRRVIEETKDEIEEAEEEEEEEEAEEGASSSQMDDKKKIKDTKNKRKITDMDDDDDDYITSKYGLDDYDDDDEQDFDPVGGFDKVALFASNDDDPYITDKREDQSDDEDFEIQPTDNLIVTGRAHEDASHLEVLVYNEVEQYLYLHHDYLLPAFPLTVETINYDVGDTGDSGCYAAIGTMKPTIEVWDLNIMESLEPAFKLKGASKKKKKKSGTVGGHSDAVLDLSWNSVVGNVLASGSADFTIALWDLSELKVVTSLTQHIEKVQCVKWHPLEAQSLLSGSFDHTVKVYDCRNPNTTNRTWNLQGEVERIVWNHFSPMHFFASTDNGQVFYFDIREDKPIYKFKPHDKAVTGLCLSSQIPGLLVTTSDDKKLKVWDVQDNKPQHIIEKNLKINELHCVGCCPEAPFVFAAGGDKEAKVWDIRESLKVRQHFFNRMPVKLQTECEGDEADISEDSGDEAVGAMNTLTLHNEQTVITDKTHATATVKPKSSTIGKQKKTKNRKRRKKLDQLDL
ncbi:periodic tryptophan protein 1 homolog [Patella vulgata]|uniref:periodic tryptophan protein 1 homolog n=1 Tax=Patella vulgata TaxID=6465 RepID=UPI0024A9A00E|nr:periodic tryptophan protein 1 homolog [Patella vulgata]